MSSPISRRLYVQRILDLYRLAQPGYVSYIRYKLATLAPDFVAAGDYQLP